MSTAKPQTSMDNANKDQDLARAHEAADRRARFYGQMVIFVLVVAFLGTVGGCEAGAAVAFIWGAILAYRGYHSIVAPGLKRKWVDEELKARERQRQAEGPLTMNAPAPVPTAPESRTSRSLEELSASIAHEIRNPITAAKSLVQQIVEDPKAAESAEYAKVALEELDRVERSISHLLRFAREEPSDFRELELSLVIDSATETIKDRATKGGVRLFRDDDGRGAMRGDPEKLRRVVCNLLNNALDALEQGPTPAPEIRISSGRNLKGDELWLKVWDNGPGISQAKIARIWNPFYTSKTSGTGLGLAITKKIVEEHGGSIEARSHEGLWTEFTVTFKK